MPYYIKAPLINVNEDSMLLVEWQHEKGDTIRRGEVICVLETSKSTYDLQSEQAGFFTPLTAPGETVKVGQIIAAISEDASEEIQVPITENNETLLSNPETDSAKLWTKKAEVLALRHGMDITLLAKNIENGTRFSEEDVLKLISQKNELVSPAADQISRRIINRTQRVLILGGGNIAVLLLDILARIPHQTAVGILDDNPALHGTTVLGCPVLGNLEEIHQLWEKGFFDVTTLAIGVLPLRAELYNKFTQADIPFGNVIDPSALILADVAMGNGNLIMGFCRIGPQCNLGNNNFLSAYVNLEHHNTLGDHCTFGPGVFTSGGVQIGSRTRFGTGIFIEPRLGIGSDVTIASGAILTTNVPDNITVRTKTNFSFYHPEG
jgi:sugar O-acyltransferase (sialic acid O-acetyltransferase NeuD family)